MQIIIRNKNITSEQEIRKVYCCASHIKYRRKMKGNQSKYTEII